MQSLNSLKLGIGPKSKIPAPAVPFNPLTDIPWRDVYWAEAPQTTPFVADGAVAQWDDNAAAAKHVVQATGALQPTYRSSVAAMNNKPAIEFVNDMLGLDAATFGTLAQPLSIVTVMKWTGADASTDVVVGTPTATPFIIRKNASGFQLFGGAGLASGVMFDDNTHLFAGVFNNTNSATIVDTVVTVGPGGTNSMEGITVAGNNGSASSQTLYIAFIGIYNAATGDIRDHAKWSNLKAWTARYGIAA